MNNEGTKTFITSSFFIFSGENIVTKLKKKIIVQGEESKESLGLVHILTGEGKGKKTAALGLGLRAAGRGYNVYMIQFLKSGGTGELYAVKHMPNFTIEQFGIDAILERVQAQTSLASFAKKESSGHFVFRADVDETEAAKQGFEHAKKIIISKNYDLVILDEINCILDKKLISLQEVIDLLKQRNHVEIVMTGRDAPQELYEYADYVGVITPVKHPWQKGIKARKGIEY